MVSFSLQLAAVGNGNLAAGFATLWATRLHFPDNIYALNNVAKHNVLPIQPGGKIRNEINPFHVFAVFLLGQAYQVVLAVQMKNCDPLVLGPALAMDSVPAPVCFKVKFSSANFSP